LEDDEDVLGSPSFHVLVRDGEALVSTCYVMKPDHPVQAPLGTRAVASPGEEQQ